MASKAHSKIATWPELENRLDELRVEKKRIVFTNGCFDLLHPGHVEILEFAKSHGDILVVGLNSDASVKHLKGPGRPIQDQLSRAVVLGALEAVDIVTIFDGDTPAQLVKLVRPNALVKGADWEGKEIAGGAFVKSYGGRVVFCPLVENQSTSEIVRRAFR